MMMMMKLESEQHVALNVASNNWKWHCIQAIIEGIDSCSSVEYKKKCSMII